MPRRDGKSQSTSLVLQNLASRVTRQTRSTELNFSRLVSRVTNVPLKPGRETFNSDICTVHFRVIQTAQPNTGKSFGISTEPEC